MDFNNYIDFQKMFCDLISYHEEELRAEMKNSGTLGEIARFASLPEFKEWDILPDECAFHDENVSFIFGFDFDDANESNTQSTTADVHIIYNRFKERFSYYKYEQG